MSGSSAPSTPPPRAGEAGVLSREALAAEDELAVAVLLGLQRLAQQSTLYLTENEALRRALGEVQQAVQAHCAATGRGFALLFLDRAVYVGRRLLRASRAIYATAGELKSLLGLLGATEIQIAAEVTLDELRALQAVFRGALRDRKQRSSLPVLGHVRLRVGRLPSEAADFDRLSAEEQAVRSYALGVVVMRRFLEALQRGTLELPSHLRRVAAQLVLLSEHVTPGFLGATVAKPAPDDAARAIHAVIVALCMARQLTDDKRLLSRIAFGALLGDVGVPRVAGLDADAPAPAGLRLPALGREQYRELPAATAVVTTVLGKLTDAGVVHSVLVYEALHLRYRAELGVPYGGHLAPSLLARIVATARAFAELLSDTGAGEERTVDTVLAIVAAAAQSEVERRVLRLLCAAIGAFPRDSVVELSTGQRAQVVLGARDPADLGRPVVRLLVPVGATASAAELLDLASAHEPPIHIVRLVSTPAEQAALAPATAGLKSLSHPATRISSPVPSAERVTFKPPRRSDPAEPVAIPPSTRLPSFSSPAPAAPPTGAGDAASGSDPQALVGSGPRALPAPSSHGTLRKTPLVHLLVYALDNALSGSLLLGDPAPVPTGILFRAGVPSRAQTPPDVAPLEDMLDEMGVLVDEQLRARLEGAQNGTAQPASALVAEGLIGAPILREALERQLARRLGYLLTLEPATPYAYYDGVDGLGGGLMADGQACDPFELIMRGARIRAGDPQVGELLRQLGDRPLPLHAAADPARLGLEVEEQAITDWLRAAPLSLPELLERGQFHAQVVRATVYALLITRFIDLSGGARAPVGLRSR